MLVLFYLGLWRYQSSRYTKREDHIDVCDKSHFCNDRGIRDTAPPADNRAEKNKRQDEFARGASKASKGYEYLVVTEKCYRTSATFSFLFREVQILAFTPKTQYRSTNFSHLSVSFQIYDNRNYN